MNELLLDMAQGARRAARQLALYDTSRKNEILYAMAAALRQNQTAILAANEQDMHNAQATDLSEALLDRLWLTPERLEAIARDVEHVATLSDPVGLRFDEHTLPNGLRLSRRRVPLGVVGVIYEARPNVTVDVASLCLKAGNAVILRGGKETFHSNQILARTLQQALADQGAPAEAIQLIESTDRQLVMEFLKLDRFVDVLIPRGNAALHQLCREQSSIPVISGGIGICHMYVDPSADVQRALPVIYNAKVQRPSVCNALDTLLVHREIAPVLLPLLAQTLAAAEVEMRADERALPWLAQAQTGRAVSAVEGDWGQEFLALILAIKVVDSLDEALDHIAAHSSGHSEAILTQDPAAAQRFCDEVDSAVVYVNASTRFTDGAQFGLGAEVAVSTQKLHARGPMALEGLTTYKWIGEGNWHVRA